MNTEGQPMRPLKGDAQSGRLQVIDQRLLPHQLLWRPLSSARDAFVAIREMWVRGAPLIGAVAAYGLAMQARRDASDEALANAAKLLRSARPTAVNLAWALELMQAQLQPVSVAQRATAAWAAADALAEDDVRINHAIGQHGLKLLQKIAAGLQDKGIVVSEQRPLRILTHCNAGWLATVGWGTATSPIYQAHAAGLPVHVWVDETRPRNQGASLTAWELAQAGVPHTLIADNAGGHLMQHGQVDLCIVGCDRVTAAGDACNKVGTYLKALAAQDNGVPFYVAMPTPTLDLSLQDGLQDVPIEERSARELTHISGRTSAGQVVEVQLTPDGCLAANPAFDVTPARLVTAFITEHGLIKAEEGALRALMRTGASGHTVPSV